jgi:hypothetical protein
VLWDAIAGVKGRIRLSASGAWFMSYYADVGTGASQLTWQGLIGLGHAFSWGDLHLAYRYLHYSTDDGELMEDVNQMGPALGATFRF